MKKIYISVLAVAFSAGISAQIRTVNNATNSSVANSPAFIDASSNTTVNGSTNVGKGLLFPRVDLSAMTAFPSVTAGIPSSFPTRFDGMIVYNTASSGTAGVGSTSGTLTPGFWYYENKSATNTGGTWKPVSAGVGDNLGNHSATQMLVMNDYEVRLRAANDGNHGLIYNGTIGGPRLWGDTGGALGTVNGTNALNWDNSGNVISPASVTSGIGNVGKASLFSSDNLHSGNLSIFKGDGVTKLGFIGFDNSNMNYTAQVGDHLFNGGNIISEKAVISGSGSVGKIGLYASDNTHAGNLSIFKGDGITKVGYIGLDQDNMNYAAEVGNHNFSGGDVVSQKAVISGLGSVGKIGLYASDNTHAGNLSIFKGDGVTKLGFIGFDNSNMNYTAQVGDHLFNGGNIISEKAIISGSGSVGKAALYSSDNLHAGNVAIFQGDGVTKVGFIGFDPSNMSYNAEVGIHVFNTTIQTPRVQGPSDRRFKKDITPIYNATEKLNQLNGYTYTWKDRKEFPGQTLGEGKDMGVIAQEVEKVFPDAVQTNKEGYKSVNYNALVPVLIEALKESNKKIQALEDRLNTMKK